MKDICHLSIRFVRITCTVNSFFFFFALMYTLGVLALLRSCFSALHRFGSLLQCYFVSCPMLSVLARLNGRVLGCGYVVETLSGALHIFDSVSIALLFWVPLSQRRWRLNR